MVSIVYDTARGVFSAPSRSNSLPTVKSFTTFVPCKRRLPVHGLTDSATRLFSLLMTSGQERERKEGEGEKERRRNDIPHYLYLPKDPRNRRNYGCCDSCVLSRSPWNLTRCIPCELLVIARYDIAKLY